MLYCILALDAHMKVCWLPQKRGWWKDEGRREDSILSSSPLPLWLLCHLVMRLPPPRLVLSLCFPYSSSFFAPRPTLPSFSINPFRPKETLLSLLFILSQTPGVISSPFPTSCFFTLDTFNQCFGHLWPYFNQPFRTGLQAKTLSGLILVWAGTKHTTHNRTFPVTNRVITMYI